MSKGPPGEPSFKISIENEPLDRLSDLATVRAGQQVRLSCSAQGGNPVPTMTLTKNGESFGLGPVAFENTLQFVATALDHGAKLSCSAHNAAIDKPIDSHTVELNVLSKSKWGCMK